MPSPALLLSRLDDIAASLERRASALALLGLGSVGKERERLDEFSDLDFFAVVHPDAKQQYLDSIDWLQECHPVAWSFKNTKDGRKLLYEDGVFCEYAAFTPEEMADAHYAEGELIWARPDFDRALCVPKHTPRPAIQTDADWIVGEALSNLYVGLCRLRRGEDWTAALFVQNYAIHRVAELLVLERGSDEGRDPYQIDRRFETRHPKARAVFAPMMQGYGRTPESALAILQFIEQRFPVNPTLRAEIVRLAKG